MQVVLDVLNGDDLLSLGVLIGILCFVGSKMVAVQSPAYQWGLRLAAGGFVAYCVYGCLTLRAARADSLAAIAFRGLFAAGLVLGVAWVVLPIAGFLYQRSIGACMQRFRAWSAGASARAAQRRTGREQEERRRREEQEYARQAPERERWQRAAEERERLEGEAKKRREDAHFDCELLYSLYARDIGERFTRQMLDQFMEKYMGDAHAPDVVERRAEQLQDILRQHYEQIHPPPKFTSVEQVTAWMQREKSAIEALPVEDRVKRRLLAEVHRQYAEYVSDMMGRARV